MACVDITGQTFGILRVVGVAGKKEWDGSHTETIWTCVCTKCGAQKTLARSRLRRGKCACVRLGNSYAAKWAQNATYKTPEYVAWRGMLARCGYRGDKEYHRYGGRGIRVCDEWLTDFAAFRDHIGPRPAPGYTVDRIDSDKNYEPGNVRWATRKEQARNRRRQRLMTVNGVTKTVAEWAESAGLNYETVLWRLNQNWPPAEILMSTKKTT